MIDSKLLGGILLIVGTSVGAGMLGLPIATAQLGFFWAMILLFICWSIMTLSAFLILEANLWLPLNSNLISMARLTLGPTGQIIAWCAFLLLLYSLLCAYIAGGSDLFHNLITHTGIMLPSSMSAIIFTLVFGGIVFVGIRMVDYVNRGLMLVKFLGYSLLVLLLIPFISLDKLATANVYYLTSASALTITISSFGFATIVPSLRIYFGGDIKKLKLAILIGSLIPLLCYIAWDAAIMGVIPLDGTQGLLAMMHSDTSSSDLVSTLSSTSANSGVAFFARLFISICVLTSFLGVSLCLTDFFADGFQLEKKGLSHILIHVITYLPPLVIVLFYPNAFIRALEYAGIYSIVLLIFLPAAMVWFGRYRRNLTSQFTVMGGRPVLVILMLFSLISIVHGLLK